jgi:hypothetical protein
MMGIGSSVQDNKLDKMNQQYAGLVQQAYARNID